MNIIELPKYSNCPFCGLELTETYKDISAYICICDKFFAVYNLAEIEGYPAYIRFENERSPHLYLYDTADHKWEIKNAAYNNIAEGYNWYDLFDPYDIAQIEETINTILLFS